MHVARSQNTAADFLSWLESIFKENVQLKLRDDILTSPIEVNLQTTDVADEGKHFFLSDPTKEKNRNKQFLIFAQEAHSKQRAINEKEQELSTKVTEVIKILLNSAIVQYTRLAQSKK